MITVVGSANIDLVARVSCLPAPGETVLGTSLARFPGGKGANQAVAAARTGSDVVFLGRLGEDAHGEDLLQSLQDAGVITRHVIRDVEAPSGTALIAVEDTGENFIVVVPGANMKVAPADIDSARDVLAASRILVLQLEIPLETVHHAARTAREVGVRVILNPSPAQPLDPSLLALVDVLVANETEIGILSGSGSPAEPAAQARLLLQGGPSSVVVTLGARGALVVNGDMACTVPAFRVEAVDSTGAGDCFLGNLAHALGEGQALDEAVRFASAAAALSVGRPGAQASMPSGAETRSFLERQEKPKYQQHLP